MSRSKRDILNTERMLEQLTELLDTHSIAEHQNYRGRRDAEALRHISMTLRTWHELECGTDRGHIERRGDKEIPFLVKQRHGYANSFVSYQIPDREAGALKRLKAIMARYPELQAYVQGGPRGCALYILKPGDVPEGGQADAYYNRGLAVFK